MTMRVSAPLLLLQTCGLHHLARETMTYEPTDQVVDDLAALVPAPGEVRLAPGEQRRPFRDVQRTLRRA